MIPQNVLDALANVRRSGATNMLVVTTVVALVEELDEEAADWLRSNPTLYMEALNEMGTQINGGDEE